MSATDSITMQDALVQQKLLSRNTSYATSRPVSFVTAPSNPDDDFTDAVSDSDYESDDGYSTPAYDMSSISIARAVPALPVKSAQRVSRFLDIQTLEIKKADAESNPVISSTAPHDLYLSSEEDASSSADDFSDCGTLSDSETSQKSPKSPLRHAAQEFTAREITVVFKGKPSMVNLSRQAPTAPPPRSNARVGADVPRLRRMPTDSALPRQAALNAQAAAKQARNSMYVAQHEVDIPALSHQFLDMDPFPTAPGARKRDSLQSSRSSSQESLRRSATTRSRSKSSGRESLRSSSPSTRSLRSVSSLAFGEEKSQMLTCVHEEALRPVPVKSYTAPPSNESRPKSKRLSMYEAPSVFANAAAPPQAASQGGAMSRLRAGRLFRRHAKA
jgi:hypothetical protein